MCGGGDLSLLGLPQDGVKMKITKADSLICRTEFSGSKDAGSWEWGGENRLADVTPLPTTPPKMSLKLNYRMYL